MLGFNLTFGAWTLFRGGCESTEVELRLLLTELEKAEFDCGGSDGDPWDEMSSSNEGLGMSS